MVAKTPKLKIHTFVETFLTTFFSFCPCQVRYTNQLTALFAAEFNAVRQGCGFDLTLYTINPITGDNVYESVPPNDPRSPFYRAENVIQRLNDINLGTGVLAQI